MQAEASKGWTKLVGKLRSKSGVEDPEALAAYIKRKQAKGESMNRIPSNLIEQVILGKSPRQLIAELHDPYDEGEFQEGLRKVGENLVKCCRSLDDLRTMIGLPDEQAKQLDDSTTKCSEAVKSVKVMLHDSMNQPADTTLASQEPVDDPDPKADLEDDDDSDGSRVDTDVHKPAAMSAPKESKRSSSRSRKNESLIEQIVSGADPYLTVKHLNEDELCEREYDLGPRGQAEQLRQAISRVADVLKTTTDQKTKELLHKAIIDLAKQADTLERQK